MYMTFILIGLVSAPLLAPELTPPIEQEVETEGLLEEDVLDFVYSIPAVLSQDP